MSLWNQSGDIKEQNSVSYSNLSEIKVSACVFLISVFLVSPTFCIVHLDLSQRLPS